MNDKLRWGAFGLLVTVVAVVLLVVCGGGGGGGTVGDVVTLLVGSIVMFLSDAVV